MIFLPPTVWEIKETVKKGKGVFATKDILPGVLIGDYLGKVLRTATEANFESDSNLYLMYYSDQVSLYPEDATLPGVHLLNHSCTPNSWMYVYKGHTLFFTLRKIFEGEEITISYLFSPNALCISCPHVCLCGSEFCTGTMHLTQEEYIKWKDFSEKEAKKTKKSRIRYGKPLSPLPSYPTSFPDYSIYPLFGSPNTSPSIQNNSSLPLVKELRTLIRDSGKTLAFPHLGVLVKGVRGNKLYSNSL